jgi:hypothetical protein
MSVMGARRARIEAATKNGSNATLGFSMRCDGSDSLAVARVFSGPLARVNIGMLRNGRLPQISPPTNLPFAGNSRWAVKDSNLRPWD